MTQTTSDNEFERSASRGTLRSNSWFFVSFPLDELSDRQTRDHSEQNHDNY